MTACQQVMCHAQEFELRDIFWTKAPNPNSYTEKSTKTIETKPVLAVPGKEGHPRDTESIDRLQRPEGLLGPDGPTMA